jgi:hypothetical protein
MRRSRFTEEQIIGVLREHVNRTGFADCGLAWAILSLAWPMFATHQFEWQEGEGEGGDTTTYGRSPLRRGTVSPRSFERETYTDPYI